MRQSFEEAVEEFMRGSEKLLDVESPEDWPPPPPAPYPAEGPPVASALVLTEEIIRRYAQAIGDDNPLYTDVAYGRESTYGSVIAPGPVLVHVRYPADHGPQRPEGYPMANFLAGVAWEFYDVLRPGARFTSSKALRETFEKPGTLGRLHFLVSEVRYWDQAGALLGKAYGSLIDVPMEAMAAGRAMDVDQLGTGLLYSRTPHRYNEEEVAEICEAMASERRRGAELRWWEDVEPGESLGRIAHPPYTLYDVLSYQVLHQGLFASTDRTWAARGFRPFFLRGAAAPSLVRTHPVTRWPFTRADEHEDPWLAPYRGEPLPFDFGIQRAQIPLRLLTNWAGDAAFVRKMYTCFRRPVFYGDATSYTGTVAKKAVVREESAGVGATYAAVTTTIEGRNQVGEVHCHGFATLYLPSREHGFPRLPVTHDPSPPYVPLHLHRSLDWH